MDWFESVQKFEIDLIVTVQDKFSKYENILETFSTIFGSTYMYVFIIPILSAIDTRVYHKALVSCIISDFVNLVLKWIINEDRPYWWVHEAKVYTSLTRPTLYQTERTCETSPGSPSGHMMIAASFLFVLLIAAEKLIVHKTINYRRPLRYLARIIFTMLLVITGISRMYFATHFLHQCVFGAILGMSISETFMFMRYVDKVQRMERQRWFKIGCSMAAMVTAIFWIHKLTNGNPMASVHMAFKYCTDPLYPKPETTVIFSSIRTIAKVVGLFFAAPIIAIAPPELKLNRVISIPVVAFLMYIQWQFIAYTPKTFKLLIFYAYTFVVYAFFQYFFLIIVPKYCAEPIEKPKPKPKAN